MMDMRTSKFSGEQIIGFLSQAEVGMPIKELGGWRSRKMVDRYAKYATTPLAAAAMRIERVSAENVSNIVTFSSRS